MNAKIMWAWVVYIYTYLVDIKGACHSSFYVTCLATPFDIFFNVTSFTTLHNTKNSIANG